MTDPLLTGNQCLCRACEQYFRSVTAFEKHRVGTFRPLARRCLTVEEMKAAGMEQRGAYWISEPYSGPARNEKPSVAEDQPRVLSAHIADKRM